MSFGQRLRPGQSSNSRSSNREAQELGLDSKGYKQLVELLLSSFHGGNDVYLPVQKALEQLRKMESNWNRADILMVSDGLWHVPAGMLTSLELARKEHGVRFHGVLVGGQASPFDQICDPGRLHTFKSWDAFC